MAEARSAARASLAHHLRSVPAACYLRCENNGNDGAQPAHANNRKFKVTRMGLRTKWIDTKTEDATTVGQVKQVVVLGSGQDARPWRLKVGKGVHWYECDMADVIAAKRAQLEGAGAQVAQWHPFVCDLSQR
eukprot:jgi/Astpho2/1679/Aster-x1025